MPLDRFVLLLVVALAAAGATALVVALAQSAGHLPGLGLAAGLLVALAAYVVVRVVWDRWRDGEDDRYDGMKK